MNQQRAGRLFMSDMHIYLTRGFLTIGVPHTLLSLLVITSSWFSLLSSANAAANFLSFYFYHTSSAREKHSSRVCFGCLPEALRYVLQIPSWLNFSFSMPLEGFIVKSNRVG